MEKQKNKNEQEKVTKRQLADLRTFLRTFAAEANNVVMLGSYSGDSILAAAKLMEQCHKIVKVLDNGKS